MDMYSIKSIRGSHDDHWVVYRDDGTVAESSLSLPAMLEWVKVWGPIDNAGRSCSARPCATSGHD